MICIISKLFLFFSSEERGSNLNYPVLPLGRNAGRSSACLSFNAAERDLT